jgi:hypothetical protein
MKWDRTSVIKFNKELKEIYNKLVESKKSVYILKPLIFSGKPGKLICLTGYPNAGKTTIGNILEGYGFNVANTDEMRIEILGKPMSDTPKEEAISMKATIEKMDYYLSQGRNVIITNCLPDNWFREKYLTTDFPTSGKMLVRLKVSKELLISRKGIDGYNLVNYLWEDPDLKAQFMEGVKYMEIDTSKHKFTKGNVDKMLKGLAIKPQNSSSS